MATPEFQQLLDAGFSESFLRTPLGSPTLLRQEFLAGKVQPRACLACGALYALPRELPAPVLNSAGDDFRFLYYGIAQDRGYCSCKCESDSATPPTLDLFGDAA
jgi:hypothetical protein